MRSVYVVVGLLALPALAAGQSYPPDLSGEPNVLGAGCVHFSHGDEPKCYPPDDNGFPGAGSGSVVLNAKWVAGVDGVFTDPNELYGSSFGGAWILPMTPGAFVAWYGRWHDFDGTQSWSAGDGWIPCSGADVTGSIVPGSRMPGTGLYEGPPSSGPDLVYRQRHGSYGMYTALAWDRMPIVFADNSLVETTVVVTESDDCGAVSDTDVYRSLDPMLEMIYQTNGAFFDAIRKDVEMHLRQYDDELADAFGRIP